MIITHIIRGLNRGGAEAVLTRLVTSDNSNTHEVIVFKDMGVYGEKLMELGVTVYPLKITNAVSGIKALPVLYAYIKKTKPDVVQTWMFHADLVGGIVARLAGIKNIFWGVRAASVKLLPTKTRVIVRLCSFISCIVPNKIICCGLKAEQVMSDNLYCKNKLSVIYNGYDINKFTNDGAVVDRGTLSPKINKNDYLVAFVARYDVHKDIPNLLSALTIAVESGIKIKCLFVGEGLDQSNIELSESIDYIGLSSDIVLLGCRNDIPELMRTVDISLLSSVSEAFPNVLAESMACATPCVTTDVGDARGIVGETGWIVPHSNHKALASAIIEAVSELQNEKTWKKRKKMCRDRIVDNFSLDKMVNNYVEMWKS